ncbi:hypothetical protein [Frigoriglobus tundricola]|uniref:Uncharacterized protein n=1 Tax=Frigoriglobus tundricola TaxID=2774151 RepID=A0A6M5YID2_9BACT|nr:hypothetical protein [Frigoriglobus tundricola]QJW93795.1 hypothetical protein FTUN_1306 [Frigoriglobus tundricola]
MIPVAAPRFDLAECTSEAERGFIEALHARAETGAWVADVWRVRDGRITLSVCPCDNDPAYNCVLRTLRVDFDGTTVWFGPDETHQFATELDPAHPGVSVLSRQSVPGLAAAAADWLEREMRRPIVRHEWDRPEFSRRLWVLADTGEGLVLRDSANVFRRSDLGPPDRIVPVGGPAA